MTEAVVYQGEPGANSHIAAREMFPDFEAVAMPTFEDCFAAVEGGTARYAMIPIENSTAGRVADIHSLLPASKVHFVGEHFLPIRHQLMVLPGAPLEKVTHVFSHVQALGQCRKTLRALGLTPVVAADTAGSARQIAADGDPTNAVRSRLSKLLGAKAAQPRYEAFLERVPSFIAERARTLEGPALRQALDSYAAARDLGGIAVGLSLDSTATVFEMAGMGAKIAPARAE